MHSAVAELLLRARIALRKTVEQIAEEISERKRRRISTKMVYSWERSENPVPPARSLLLVVADVYGLPFHELAEVMATDEAEKITTKELKRKKKLRVSRDTEVFWSEGTARCRVGLKG